jgi:hypothetical protein
VDYRHFKTMGSQYQLSEVDQQNTFVGESAGGVGNVVVTRLEDSSNLRKENKDERRRWVGMGQGLIPTRACKERVFSLLYFLTVSMGCWFSAAARKFLDKRKAGECQVLHRRLVQVSQLLLSSVWRRWCPGRCCGNMVSLVAVGEWVNPRLPP